MELAILKKAKEVALYRHKRNEFKLKEDRRSDRLLFLTEYVTWTASANRRGRGELFVRQFGGPGYAEPPTFLSVVGREGFPKVLEVETRKI